MQCKCHSQRPYSECCEPYHKGVLPDEPVHLMRSRYCAYALANIDYLIDTTHPKNPHYRENHILWKKDLLTFAENTAFVDLSIVETTKDTVTFHATLFQGAHDVSFTEKSLFVRESGKWFYLNGEK